MKMTTKTRIKISYLGGILSVNAYKRSNFSTKGVVKAWRTKLSEEIRNSNIPPGKSYYVGVRGLFRDERRPDVSNLFKVISDAIQDGLQVNDKHFQLHDEGYEIGHEKQMIQITIYPLGDTV